MRDTHGVRRVLACLLAGMLLLSALPALADNAFVDLTEECKVTVNATATDDEAFKKDIAEAKVQVDLYLVAAAVKELKDESGKVIKDVTGSDTYLYQLEPAFAEIGPIPETEDIAEPRPTSEEWRALADAAAAIILDGAEIEPAAANVAAGTQITGLKAGLYAIIAHGEGMTPGQYVRTIPAEDGTAEKTVTIANSAVFEYQFQPELVSLPTKEAPEGGQANTADATPWIYDPTVAMKPGREQRKGSLTVTKTLESYKAGEKASFVFRMTVENPYAVPAESYSKVYMLNFKEPGSKDFEVTDLPAGATVTVTELYTGATYRLKDSDGGPKTIAADAFIEFSFVNEYEPDNPGGGYGILNHFYQTEGEGWDVDNTGDSAAVQEAER